MLLYIIIGLCLVLYINQPVSFQYKLLYICHFASFMAYFAKLYLLIDGGRILTNNGVLLRHFVLRWKVVSFTVIKNIIIFKSRYIPVNFVISRMSLVRFSLLILILCNNLNSDIGSAARRVMHFLQTSHTYQS